MKLVFDREAWAVYLAWQAADVKVVERINALIEDCRRHPFKGIGKPELLNGDVSGWWSRRVNREHRLVYRVASSGAEQVLQVAQWASLLRIRGWIGAYFGQPPAPFPLSACYSLQAFTCG